MSALSTEALLAWLGAAVAALGVLGLLARIVWRRRGRGAAPRARESPPPSPLPAPSDWRQGLRRTREALAGRIEVLLRGKGALEEETLARLEEVLYAADIGVRTAQDLLEAARRSESPAGVGAALEARALEILEQSRGGGAAPRRGSPHVVLVVGVNGSGKTTTIGKLASRWVREGQRVLVAAADTFRAAAIDQLETWAERAGAELVRGAPGGDPAAVAFDSLRAARARGFDVLLIDTAGRLQTRTGLMEELGKIVRGLQKQEPAAPHEVLLVLDASTGQNAIRQAREFQRAVGVTGIVLAKLDGTSKGGALLGIARELGLPVRYVGLGERIEDLADFDAGAFVRALFERDGGVREDPAVDAPPGRALRGPDS